MIHVVSGILFGHGHDQPRDWCLFAKRPLGKLRPELWELPGGKIEPGESLADALRREWREELGAEICYVDPAAIEVSVLNLEQTIVISLHEVDVVDISTIEAREHTELAWASPLTMVKSMPCSPGLYVHYAAIDRWMETRQMRRAHS